MLPTDIIQPNIILVESRNLFFQIPTQQIHKEIDFASRPALPVFLGKGVEGERRNMDASCSFSGRAHGFDTRAMPGHSGQMPPAGPPAVSVHDDRNVLREPLGIEPKIRLCLLAVQPGWDCSLQANLC